MTSTAVSPSPSDAGAFSTSTRSHGGISAFSAPGDRCHANTASALAPISELDVNVGMLHLLEDGIRIRDRTLQALSHTDALHRQLGMLGPLVGAREVAPPQLGRD